MTIGKGRLINVSNRLPVQVRKYADRVRLSRSSGGLATALDSFWRGLPGTWIGWPGPAPQSVIGELLAKASRGRSYVFRPVTLTEEEIAKFYEGFANEIVWPLFHDLPTRCNFDPDYWETYECVNRKFARAVAECAKPDDLVWIHDYHLMLVARYLREVHVPCRAGFFLHIPFPAPDVFEKLPWREPILRALLNFDLVGFQTERDQKNFEACLERLLKIEEITREDNRSVVEFNGHRAAIGTFPISIDFDQFDRAAARPEIAQRAAQLKKELSGNILVLGVDRMDYTKGIPERLKAFRVLLCRYPELRKRITLVQVVVPSREEIPNYKELRREIELLVSQINGEFTHAGWVPIHYMHRSLTRNDLLAYYRAADIALVTSLKDGMNLVAKEFCASQVEEKGVLIVSEFAGAASELQDGAILVNPNDSAGVAQAIALACKMPEAEKTFRMRLLRDIVRKYNVQRWANSFIQAASSVQEEALFSTEDEAGESDLKSANSGLALVSSKVRVGGTEYFSERTRYRLWGPRAIR